MKHRRGVAIAAAFVLIVVGTVVAAYALTADERGDIEERRAIYERFPAFPGAELIRDRSYEITGDGRGTGDYGLDLVYRLPADAKSAEVLGFIRSHIPSDWSEASDETCRRLHNLAPPIPIPTASTSDVHPTLPEITPPGDQGHLMLKSSHLVVFTMPAHEVARDNAQGVTFALSRSGDEKLLTIGELSIACDSGGDDDTGGSSFDQP